MNEEGTPALYHKGSKRWIQLLVNQRPELIDRELRAGAKLAPGTKITWHSPLANDGYREHFGAAVREHLGLDPSMPLREFWPKRGPQWDAIAQASTGDVFLVEAKAHVGEMQSGGMRARDAASRETIRRSLGAVQRELAPHSTVDAWTGPFYQFANRIAHLHFWRGGDKNRVHLVLLHFINDSSHHPTTREAFESRHAEIEHALGLGTHRLSPFIHKLFIDVNALTSPAG